MVGAGAPAGGAVVVDVEVVVDAERLLVVLVTDVLDVEELRLVDEDDTDEVDPVREVVVLTPESTNFVTTTKLGSQHPSPDVENPLQLRAAILAGNNHITICRKCLF